jgi:hypothetical protein
MSGDFEHALAVEQALEQARLQAHIAEAARARGVSWSGLAPNAFAGRSDALIAADASRRLRDLEAWRASRTGQLLRALSEVQCAARESYAAAEAVRAALARGGSSLPPADLAAQAVALAAAARKAEELMDEATPQALSGEACATNTASNSPSTASPTSSAS